MIKISDALISLGVVGWSMMNGEPTNEQEFNERFKILNQQTNEWITDPSLWPTNWNAVSNELQRLKQQEPFNQCKAKAKDLIALTDWAVLPDVNLQNKAEFEAYRATLRDLIFNPVADPVWPVEPTPIPATQGA